MLTTLLALPALGANFPFTLEVDNDFSCDEHRMADMDRDGDPDIVCRDAWYELAPSGDLQSHPISGDWDGSFAVVDLNGDHAPDLVVSSYDATLAWLESGADGRTMTEHVVDDQTVSCISTGDVDGDGSLDIVARGQTGGGLDALLWYAGDGAGGFGPAKEVTSGMVLDGCVTALHDFDGDGKAEIWWTNADFSYEEFSIFTYDAGGWLESERPSDEWSVIPSDIHLHDMDGDGDQDMVVGTVTTTELWENVDGVVVKDQVIWQDPNSVRYVAARMGDIDLDGDLDVLNVPGGFNSTDAMQVLYNDGGAYTPSTVIEEMDSAAAGSLTDIDCDGDLDVVYTTGWLHVLLNETSTGPRDCTAAAPGDAPGEGTQGGTGQTPGGGPGGAGGLSCASVVPGAASGFGGIALILLVGMRRRGAPRRPTAGSVRP